MSPPERRTAIVLSGGASYGSYEIGVMKALAAGKSPATQFRPFEPGVVVGTSAGAFNAAILAGLPEKKLPEAAAELERIWLDEISTAPDRCGNGVIRYRVFPVDAFRSACWTSPDPLQPLRAFAGDARKVLVDTVKRGANFIKSDENIATKALGLVDLGTYISGQPFRDLVAREVKPAAIRGSWRTLKLSATNWLTGEVRVFGNDEMSDTVAYEAVLASSAVPGIFSTVDIEGVPFADGGVVMNTPLRPAVEAGADEIHLISVSPEAAALRLPPLPNSVNTFYRVLAISLAASINRDVEIAARLNDGIAILEAAEKGTFHPGLPMHALILALGGLANRPLQNLPYRKLTIHRHQLSDQFDSFFQWLDFDLTRITGLIEKGYQDAVAHDCAANGCVGV